MLSEAEILRVYELLDRGMVEGDCGGPCGAFCCTRATSKYLLPGEEAIFRRHHPDVPVVARPWYTQVIQEECCCIREHRMFACRAFPFRPVLAPEGAVAGLTKADDPLFEPCWIESPLPEWAPRAREAWSIVLGDTDSRLLYGRIRFLSNLLDSLGKTFHAIPVDEIDRYFRDRIVRAGEEGLLALCCEYFPRAGDSGAERE